jgi:hypothetical protein
LLIETDDSKVFHAHDGRPWDIDGQGNEEIAAEIRALNARTRGPFFSEFPKLLQQKKRDSMQRAGKRVYEDILPTVSASQIRDMTLYLNIKKRKAQDLTVARLLALIDVRVTYKIVCCLLAFSGTLSAPYKWNFDGTTVVVSKDHTNELVCHIHDKGDTDIDTKWQPLNNSRIPSEMNLLVKWMHLCNALGECSDLTLIVAVLSMAPDTFCVQEVMGMSNCDKPCPGRLYFCESRAGCAAVWNDYFIKVVVPTLTASDNMHKHKVCFYYSWLWLTYDVIVTFWSYSCTGCQWRSVTHILELRRRGNNPRASIPTGSHGFTA